MKAFTFLACLMLAFLTAPVFAQSRSVSGSTSASNASASPHQSQSARAEANNAFTYAPVTNVPGNTTSNNRDNQHVSGLSPDLMAGGYAASAAQDNCSSTSQGGASAFGAAAFFGHASPDQQCYNLRSADYRDRMAFAMEVLAKNHPGFEGQAINAELAQLHEMNVDICTAEHRRNAAGCEAWATEHTPSVAELAGANIDSKPVAPSH